VEEQPRRASRSPSYEQYYRQAALCTKLAKENEDLKAKLTRQQELYLEDLTARELQSNAKVYALNQKLQDFQGRNQRNHREMERVKGELENRVGVEEARLMQSFGSVESAVGLCEERVNQFIEKAQANLQAVNAVVSGKVVGLQELREEHERMLGKLYKTEQDLSYKDQELRMAVDDHEITVVRLQEELSRAKGRTREQGDLEVRQLREQVSKLKGSLESAKQTIKALQEDNEELQTECSQARAEAQELSLQKDTAESSLQTKCAVLERNLNRLRKDYSFIEKQTIDLQRANEAVSDHSHNSPLRMSPSRRSPSRETREYSYLELSSEHLGQLSSLELSGASNQLKKTNHKLKEEVKDLRHTVALYKERVAELQQQLHSKDDDLTSLEQERSYSQRLREQMMELKNQFDLGLTKSSEFASHIEMLQRHLKEQCGKTQQYDQENSVLRLRVSELEDNVTKVACSVQNLSEENVDMQKTLVSLNDENADLKDQLREASEQAHSLTLVQRDNKRRVEAEGAERKALVEEKANLERLISHFKETLEGMRNSNAELKKAREETAKELKACKEAEATAKQEVRVFEERTKSLANELKRARKETQKELKACKEAEATARQEARTHEERAKSLANELKQSTSKLAKLQKSSVPRQVEELTEKAALAEGAVQIMKMQTDELLKTVETLRHNKGLLDSEVAELKEQLKDLEDIRDLNEGLTEEMERLRTQMQEDEERLREETDEQVADLKGELEVKDQEIASLEEQSSALEKQVEELEAKLSTAEDQVFDLSSKAELYQVELELYQQKEAEHETSIDSLFKKLDKQADMLRSLEDEKAKLESAKQETAEELKLTNLRFEQLGKQYQELNVQMQNLIEADVHSERKSSPTPQTPTATERVEDRARDEVKVDSLGTSKWLDDKDLEISELSFSFALGEKEKAAQELVARAAKAEAAVEELKASEGRLEQIVEALRKAVDKLKSELNTTKTASQSNSSLVVGLTEEKQSLLEQLEQARTEKDSLEYLLVGMQAKLEDLEFQKQMLSEQGIIRTTSLNTEDLEEIKKELQTKAPKTDEADVTEEEFYVSTKGLEGRQYSTVPEGSDVYNITSRPIKTGLEGQGTDEGFVMGEYTETLEQSGFEDQGAYRVEQSDSQTTPNILRSQCVVSQAEVEPSEDRGGQGAEEGSEVSEQLAQKILTLEQVIESLKSELQEALERSVQYQSVARSLEREVEGQRTKTGQQQDELLRRQAASELLEQKLADAEFQGMVLQDTLKQKGEELDSLILHCERLEEEVDRSRAKDASQETLKQQLEDFASGLEMSRVLTALDALSERVTRVHESAGRAKARYTANLAQLAESLEQQRQEAVGLTALVASLRESEQALQGHSEALEGSSDETDYRRENFELKADLVSLQVEQDELEGMVEALSTDNKTKDDLIQQLTDQLEEVSRTIDSCRTQIDHLQAKVERGKEAEARAVQQFEEACRRLQKSDGDRALLEIQLQSALNSAAPGGKTDLTVLLLRNSVLEKEVRRLQDLQDHCDELELKEKAMNEKVKALMMDREHHQQLIRSLSADYTGVVLPYSAKTLLTEDGLLKEVQGPLNDSRSDSIKVDNSLDEARWLSTLKDSESNRGRRTEEAEHQMSGLVSASFLQEQLAGLGETEQRPEGTLGEGNFQGHEWSLYAEASDILLVIDSKLVFSSGDWRHNPTALLDCFERLAQTLAESAERAEVQLKEVISELRCNQGSRGTRHVSCINFAFPDPAESPQIEDQSESFHFNPENAIAEFKSSDASLELSDYSSFQSPKRSLTVPSREVSELKQLNAELHDKSLKLQQRLSEQVEDKLNAKLTRRQFLGILGKLPQKDTKTEEFITKVCGLLELSQTDRAKVEHKRRKVSKGFFSYML
jgi:chromosome segregation ATPase